MKSAIKFIMILTAVWIVNTEEAAAQCRITYNYDVAGNRIQRKYDCSIVSGTGSSTDFPMTRLLNSLSPNPTPGTLNGTFAEAVETAFIQIADISGNTVLTYTIAQLTGTFSIDISAVVPGTYILTVWASGLEESYTVIKM